VAGASCSLNAIRRIDTLREPDARATLTPPATVQVRSADNSRDQPGNFMNQRAAHSKFPPAFRPAPTRSAPSGRIFPGARNIRA